MQATLKKRAIVTSVFACAVTLSLGWMEQGGISLSIESAQARGLASADAGERHRRCTPDDTSRVLLRRGGSGGIAVQGGALVGASPPITLLVSMLL
jgi:hypothetical protein